VTNTTLGLMGFSVGLLLLFLNHPLFAEGLPADDLRLLNEVKPVAGPCWHLIKGTDGEWRYITESDRFLEKVVGNTCLTCGTKVPEE